MEFGILLVGLRILARLAARFRFSAVPLFLLAGLAFGDGGLVPLGVDEEFVQVTAEIGAVLLLLLLGLEYSGEELISTVKQQWWAKHRRHRAQRVAQGNLPGCCSVWGMLGAVALGGITYISSSGIVAQVVRPQVATKGRSARVVGLLIVEDIVMARTSHCDGDGHRRLLL